jgi:hypothetical protein
MVSFSDFSVFSGRPLAHQGWQHGRGGGHFDPNQPRVPKGNPGGGQWTDDGRGRGEASDQPIRLASKDPPERLPARRGPSIPTPRSPGGGRGGLLGLLIRLGLQAIGRYLEENRRPDLVGGGSDNVTASGRAGDGKSTVAVTWINDKAIFGSNSGNHGYTAADYSAARTLRDILIRERPDIMDTTNIGGFPNDGLFHAETTALLRAAKANGGTLAGKTLEVVVNGRMCSSCMDVLPIVTKQLGSPTVFFTDLKGVRLTVRDNRIVPVRE